MEKSFNAAEVEPRISKAWEEARAFAAGKHVANDETGSFCVMIPPPNVTGALHVGHAFNNTLQDILTRWHRMRGFDTLWQPGQDHAGIATQLQVEKKLMAEEGKRRTDLSREAFLGKVWDWKTEYAFTIIDQLKRLGCSCDWDRNAFTMAGAPGDRRVGHENSANFHDAVIKVFVEMYEKGLIYRGKRLVNWDPHFETAISDLEVENIETPGHMWHFKYPLAGGATYEYLEKDEEGNVVLREERDYISIATTRPETMLGDGAVAVHVDDERYAPIVGKLCEIPVGPKEHRRLIPIITDPYPDPNFGSGAVKITGAHDFNDYEVAKRGGIPMYRLMAMNGTMRADGVPYAEAAGVAMAVARGQRTLTVAEADTVNLVPDHLRGLDRFEARKAIVDEITADGLAVMTRADDTRLGGRLGEDDDPAALVPLVEAKPIMQPFGDRSKVVIEPMLTDQWFVETSKIVGDALDAVRSGEIRIMPESGEKTYYHWLENIEPWCISRQLWWGHQIPVWYGPRAVEDSNDYYCAASFEQASQAAVQKYSALYPNAKVTAVEGDHSLASMKATGERSGVTTGISWTGPTLEEAEQIEIRLYRDADVLDTWFSSGLWPIGTLGWPEETDELKRFFSTDVLITGFDILFFWVARMIMMQYAVVGEKPFHTVYLHQLVRDEKGKKMSKTTGNVIDPLEIVDEYGADALRFTNASMASIGGVLKLSVDRIKGYRNFGTKIWQAASFGGLKGIWDVPHQDTIPQASLTLNRWIIGELAQVREAVDTALAEYRFNDAASALYAFFWGTFCDRYLEFTKPIFDEGGSAADETRAVYAWVLDQSLILMHPIMPFITEELWGQKARPHLLVHAPWPGFGVADLGDADAAAEMGFVIDLIDGVNSARAQVGVKAGDMVPMLAMGLSDAQHSMWTRNEALVKRRARIASLDMADSFPKGCITIPVGKATFGLPVADLIDVAAEKARLEKTLTKLGKELGGLRGRLKNPKFLESAPEEIVVETQANLAARESDEAKLRDALARLAEIA